MDFKKFQMQIENYRSAQNINHYIHIPTWKQIQGNHAIEYSSKLTANKKVIVYVQIRK